MPGIMEGEKEKEIGWNFQKQEMNMHRNDRQADVCGGKPVADREYFCWTPL